MPHDLPPWHTVYQQSQRWRKAKVFEALVQCALIPIYPSSGTKRLFCGRQLHILQDVFFEGRGTMSQTLSQRRMTHRSDRVDDVVLTGQHLPADWHRDANQM
jgi:hypothetical protein